VLLAIVGWYVERSLTIGTDLRLFMPSPTTAEQRLLLDEIGEGPASRVLVVALSGAAPEKLADTSRALADALSANEHFRRIANGDVSVESVPEDLLPYRFLLSPTLDTQAFDATWLHAELQTRARDLASPAGAFLEQWLPRDPTLEMLKLAERWQPVQEPNRLYDVWFDTTGTQALLIAETRAAAFDPAGQRLALEALDREFASVDADASTKLTVSGSGRFSVMMEQRTRREAQWLGGAATIGMLLLLLAAYRRVGSVIVSALPLASAGVAGLAAVSLVFGTVHGITLAFGFTLIGVAQDYPMHLLSHQHAGRSPHDVVRELWPTLATGVASTCIAYLTFAFSGVVGLAQLACFTVAALGAAALTTRYLLPRLIEPAGPDHGDSARLAALWTHIEKLPRPLWLVPLLLVGSIVAVAASRTPLWENDLSKLSPVPRELLQVDQRLRSELGAPDLRHLLVVSADTTERALEKLERLDPQLQALVERGVISGYDHAARYVPTVTRQRERQSKLPDEATLRTMLQRALADTSFRTDAFEPFIADVGHARRLAPLDPGRLRDTPLGAALEVLLHERDGHLSALVTVNGVRDVAALRSLAGGDVVLLDLRQAAETLVADQRSRILASLGIAAVALIGVVAFALRRRDRILRVLAPMAVTTALVIAVLHLTGGALSLFHLIALILAAGLGLDYALFFEHAADDPHDQRRTLHAVLVCSFSTLMVFALLATSELPVLRAIGLTVTLGVVFNFLLALLLTREWKGSRLGAWDSGQSLTDSGPGVRGSGQNLSSSGPSPAPRAPSPAIAAASTPIASLTPHQGTMCLLERIVTWDEERIVLESTTHRAATNPLRVAGRLRALHLCEYGAQAMAVHGALKAQAHGSRAAPGMLVSLRGVRLTRDYIENLPGALEVTAQCLQASATSLQYSFRVTHANELLAEGRAAIVLREGTE
jgi:predicted exporter/predicted hotdog family 3-hydroxylacyl-ACP dehydratase